MRATAISKFRLLIALPLLFAAAMAQADSCSNSGGDVGVKYWGNGLLYSSWIKYDVKIKFNAPGEMEMYVNEGVNSIRAISNESLSMWGQTGEIKPRYWHDSCNAVPFHCLATLNRWLSQLQKAESRIVEPSDTVHIACAKQMLNDFAKRIRNEILQKRNIEGNLQ